MKRNYTYFRTIILSLFVFGLVSPVLEARQANEQGQFKKRHNQDQVSRQHRSTSTNRQYNKQNFNRQKAPERLQLRNYQQRDQDQREPLKRYKQLNNTDRQLSQTDGRKEIRPQTRRNYNRTSESRTRHQNQIQNRDRTKKYYKNRIDTKRHNVKGPGRSSHDHHYRSKLHKLNRVYRYPRHETYHYHTHYLSPIRRHYYPYNFRLSILPRSYVRIHVHGLPYFYFGGVFARGDSSGYIVVHAPIGAMVSELPSGFISLSIGGLSYFYVNDAYYLWNNANLNYVVVEKPDGAETAITEATEGRLYVYPKNGQTEEQQSNDRYECHRWAVSESRVDPTLVEEEISAKDSESYKRAISACLEGRDYTVK